MERPEQVHRIHQLREKLFTYKDFSGIRNEEDYLITENGARLLGKNPFTYGRSEKQFDKSYHYYIISLHVREP